MSQVSDATSRLQLRRRDQRRRRSLTWLVGALAVVLIIGAVYVVGFSPALAARAVTVNGARVLTKAEVLEAAGVAAGTPLVWVDPSTVAERVSGLPAVAEVTVSRDWPDTVHIAVTERKPRLAIPAGGGYLLADASGVVFQAVDNAPSGLVVVEADPNSQQVLVDVGTVFSALSSATAAKVSRLEAPTRDGIVLRLRDGSRVVWGSAEESPLKSQVLDALLPLGGSVFNVSAPGFPTRR
ncbi:MAG TPA: FtsQ-type POTRA domain-containing protein [Propionicimonas sp.]|uniref:cell division protein FtsQ/DivIB n=1 Tax=Propionicimonas sp. TaxID=1955623 RepID=UPI002F3E8EFA